MKRWDGIRRDLAYAQDGAYFLKNGRFYIEGELQRRPGLTRLASKSGTSIVWFRHPVTGQFAIFASNGNVDSVAT